MRRTICMLSLIVFSMSPTFAQTDYWYPKHALGFSLSVSHFKLYDFNNKSLADEYEELFSNSSLDADIWYNKTLNNLSSLQFEFKNCGRYSIQYLDTFNLGVSESFLEFPILYKFNIMSNRIGYNPVNVFCGLGISYSLLTKQNLFVPKNQSLPSLYKKETGFGRYSKLGIVTDFGVSLDLSSNYAGIILGYRSSYDAFSFFKSSDIKITPNYWMYGFYLGFYARFGKSE